MPAATLPTSLASSSDLQVLRNRTFDELQIGETATIERTVTKQDLALFAIISGDSNPQHLDADFAASTRFHGVIAHGMLGGALISAVLGTRLPGPGTVYLGQSLRFLAPVHIGDVLRIEVKVLEKEPLKRKVTLQCRCLRQDDVVVIDGQATVLAPDEHIERPRTALPEVRLQEGEGALSRLFAAVLPMGPLPVAVIHPCDALTLGSALEGARQGLIQPVLVAPLAKLQRIAQDEGWSLDGVAVRDVPHSHAAAAEGARMAAAGEVAALMKGSLHTDEFMGAVVAGSTPLRTGRRMSHCFLMQSPAYPKPFIITDAAINIAPSLEDKADIIRNAIDLAHAIGVDQPKVAILAAVETVNPRMPATLDAAALCKMADRGQIAGAVLDGPLAFDNAVSVAAARIKGIQSPVAGQADVLVVPDLESGNMLAKQLEYLGGAVSAGVVLGAKVPLVLTSRADSRESRLASMAVASLLAHAHRQPAPSGLPSSTKRKLA